MVKYILILFFLFLTSIANANIVADYPTDFDSSEPITLSIKEGDDFIGVFFTIEKGSYLYKEKIKVSIDNKIIPLNLESGHLVEDLFFGKTEVYYDSFFFQIKNKGGDSIKISYQGCSELLKVCYLPKEKQMKLIKKIKISDDEEVTNYFDFSNYYDPEKNIFINILLFFIFGVVVSLTPCVLPMIPILSSILISKKNDNSRGSALKISFSYVIGMSTAYVAIGVLIALVSFNVQILLQEKLFILLISSLFLILALLMSDALQVKTSFLNSFKDKVNALIEKIGTGNLFGVVALGFLSSLILSPCVAIPLAAASLYIAETGSLIVGGIYLFVFGLGSGVLLILISSSLRKISLFNGKLALEVKYFLSLLMFILAAYTLGKIYGFLIFNVLTFSFILVYSSFLFYRVKGRKQTIVPIIIVIISSIINAPYFYEINVDANNKIESILELETAKKYNKKILIKVEADWCIYCKKMNVNFFNNVDVFNKGDYKNIYTLDLTNMSKEKKILIEELKIIAPPEIILLDGERVDKLIGYRDNFEIMGFLNKNNF